MPFRTKTGTFLGMPISEHRAAIKNFLLIIKVSIEKVPAISGNTKSMSGDNLWGFITSGDSLSVPITSAQVTRLRKNII